MKKLVTMIVFMSLIGIGAYGLFFRRSSDNDEQFIFARVTRGDLERIVSSTGTLSAVGTVQVGAQVSADIKKIFVDYNDEVKKGQILAVFDTTLFKAEVQKAEAEVNSARVKLDQAEAEYKRNQPLFEKGFLSETEFLAVKSDLESARAQLKVTEANLESARTNLKYAVIRSPIDGKVIERSVEAGQSIVSRMATPTLFVIAADMSKMQIMADVDESDIGQIKVGQAVRFTVQAYPDETFRGVVRQIRLQPKIVQNVVNYTVVVDAANESERLLPGMTATVDFLIEQKKNVLLVPQSAVQFNPPLAMLIKPSKKILDESRKKHRGGLFGAKSGGPLNAKSGRLFGTKSSRRMNAKAKEPFGVKSGRRMNAKAGGPLGFKPRGPAAYNGWSRVFIQVKRGKIRPILFIPGSTNGSLTEVKQSPELHEGMKIIVGQKVGDNKGEKKNKANAFRFRRRGPHGPPPF